MTRNKTNKQTLPGKSRLALVFEELEPRLLLSADLPVDLSATLAPEWVNDELVSVHEEITTTSVSVEHYTARELVFVDTDTPDYQLLIDDMLGNSNNERQIEVILLDNSSDGIDQITSALSEYSELDAVHIISHGSDGSIDLGGTRLEFDTLLANSAAIQSWSEAFSENGDLLIYGCDLAASESGQALVDSLARLSGADVAASDDLTGSATLGGDWELEYHTGDIESEIALSGQMQSSFTGVLGNIAVTTSSDVVSGDADTTSLANLFSNPGSDSFVSLREAIIAANTDTTPGTDTITLAVDTYTLASGALQITGDTTINGAGIGQTIIDGASLDRVFDITSGTITLSNLTIQGGDVAGSGNGGGVNIGSLANVTLDTVEITGNTAIQGGAINNEGTLDLTDVSISGNTTTGKGAGLFNLGTATLTGVTISGNNSTADDGGGVFNDGTSFLAINVTISGNSADRGGGLYEFSANPSTLQNVTITNNTAASRAGGVEVRDASLLTVSNTIIAGNTAPTVSDLKGTITSLGNNLIDNSADGNGYIGSDILDVSPLLGVLADNGGPTQTHVLLVGSTAINAGTSTGAPVTDQRGITRNDGFIDIGAYEAVNDFISGTLYSDEGVTAFGAGSTVRLLVNGVDQGTTTTDANGRYTFFTTLAANDTVLAYVDGDDGSVNDGTTVTVVDGDGLTGLDIYVDRLITRHDNAGVMTNALLDAADGAGGDTEILYSVDGSNNLTVNGSNSELYVHAGHTFTPGADVASHDIEILGTVIGGSNNISVSGNWDSGNGTFFQGFSTVFLNGTGTLNAAGNSFYNLTTGSASQVTTLTSDLTVAGVLTIADSTGILTDNGAGYDVEVTGAGTPFVNNGATVTAKNFIYRYPTDATITAAGGTYNVAESLYFAGSGTGSGTTYRLNGDLLVNGGIDIYATSFGVSILDTLGHSITANNLQVSNSAFQVGFLYANNSTIDINGDVAFVNSVTTNVILGSSDWYVYGDWANTSNTFDAGSSTVSFDGSSQTISGSTAFYNFTKIESTDDANDSVLIFDSTATQTVNGTLTLDGLDTDDRINLISDDPTNQWSINLTATAIKGTMDYLDVTDSDASGSDVSQKAVDPLNSFNSGNNIDWFNNSAPIIGGTVVGQVVNDNATIEPFRNVVIADNDVIQSLTVTVTLDVAANGVFSTLNGFSDSGGGVYTFSGTAAAATSAIQGLVFDPSDNRVAPGSTETTTFTISVDDGVAVPTTDTSTTVVSTSINDAPIAVDDSYNLNEGSGGFLPPMGVLLNDFDIDSGSLTAIQLSNTTNGTLSLNPNGSWWYTPDPDYYGTDSFTYKVNDGSLDSNIATVTLNIAPRNDAPVGTDNTVTTLEDTDYVFSSTDFGFSDPVESDSLLAVRITTLPGAGTLTLAGTGPVTVGDFISKTNIDANKLVFTPAVDANGSAYASFTFQVQDDGGAANGGVDLDQTANTLTIDVTSVNDAPISTTDSFTVNEDSTTNLNLLANDTDADDGPDLTSITLVSGPTNGSIVINADGTVDYAHDGGETVADSFTYTVNDVGGATSNVGTVNLGINPVNDAPIHSVPGAQTTSDNTALIFSSPNGNSITVADPDASGAPVEVTLTASNGTLSLAGNSGLSFIVGDGSSGTTMTFTGTAADINTAMNGLQFQSDVDYQGMATVQIISDDLGNSGAGGALNAMDSVSISVTSSATTTTSKDTLPPLDELILHELVEETLDPPVHDVMPATVGEVLADEPDAGDEDAANTGSESVTATSGPAAAVITGSGRGIPTQGDISLPGQVTVSDYNLQSHDDNGLTPVKLLHAAMRQGLVDPLVYAKMLVPLQSGISWEAIEAMMDQMDDNDDSWYRDDQVLIATTATGLTVSFTAGYVSWVLRAGYLSASMLSILPLWREFDPLPVLARTRENKRKLKDSDKESQEINDIESEKIFNLSPSSESRDSANETV